MAATKSYKPQGFSDVTPYFVVELGMGAKLIKFLESAFGAQETAEYRSATPDGRLMHAQLRLGDSNVELGEADQPSKAARMSIHYYVKDIDSVHARAVAAGGKALMEPTDQFYGERSSGILDPCGNSWWLATQIEELSKAEIDERAEKMAAGSR